MRQTLGDDSPATLSYTHNRALACADLGRPEEALDLLSECLARRRRILGDRHMSTLKTERGIASVLLKCGKYKESREISESILARLGTSAAVDHTFRGNVLVNLGKCLTAAGEYPEAERALRKARAIFLKKVGPQHRFSRAAAEALEELLERKARTQAQETIPSEQTSESKN